MSYYGQGYGSSNFHYYDNQWQGDSSKFAADDWSAPEHQNNFSSSHDQSTVMETDDSHNGGGSSSSIQPDSEVMKMYIRMYPNASSTDFLEFLDNFQAKKESLVSGSSGEMTATKFPKQPYYSNDFNQTGVAFGNVGHHPFQPYSPAVPSRNPKFNNNGNFQQKNNQWKNGNKGNYHQNKKNMNGNFQPFNQNKWNNRFGNNASGSFTSNLGKRPFQKQNFYGNGASQNKFPKKQAYNQQQSHGPKNPNSSNFSVDANGNYNLDNAQRKLNEYCLKNKIPLEIKCAQEEIKKEAKEGDSTKQPLMTASLSINVIGQTGFTKTVSASGEDIHKKDACRKCALDMMLQLYKMKAIGPVQPDSVGAASNGFWTNETSIARVKQFCFDRSIDDHFVTTEEPDRTYATSFAFKSAKDSKLKHINATCRAKNRKLSTQLCALKILTQLYNSSLVEAKGKAPIRPGSNKPKPVLPGVKTESNGVDDFMQKHPNATQQLRAFCRANNITYDIAYEEEFGTDKKWKFTASTSIDVTLKDGSKKTFHGFYVAGKKKLAAKGCWAKIAQQLYGLGLIEIENRDGIEEINVSAAAGNSTPSPADAPWSLTNCRNVIGEVCTAYELDNRIDYAESSGIGFTALMFVTLVVDGKNKLCKTSGKAKDKKTAAKIASLNMLNELAKHGLKWPDNSHKLVSDGAGLEKNGYYSMATASAGIKRFCNKHKTTPTFDFSKEEKKEPLSRTVYTAKLTIDAATLENNQLSFTGSFTAPGRSRAHAGACLNVISQLWSLSLIDKYTEPIPKAS